MVQRSSCVLLRILTKKEDLLVPKLDAEQLPHEIYATVGSKEATTEETQRTEMNYELNRRTR